ncbi:glycosyltransferase [Flavobacteriaceae bacterium AH-315-B10]|nr:glycosyltransferase [Flavobacteriaceae bacterium AH-315-B10]
MNIRKRILVAPLNWGLGHAARCIPIINALIKHSYEPIIASDGNALQFLKKEFPDLEAIELPSYNIKYPKKGHRLKWKLLKVAPNIINAVKAEKKLASKIIDTYNIKGIISDNRFGVFSKKTPSVYITHQLNVLSRSTTLFSSKMHQKIIKKFDECWIPDIESEPNLSGKLGHLKNRDFNLKYIGSLSRFKKIDCDKVYDLLVLLSGPEPQRTFFEEILFKKLKAFEGNILFIKGKIETDQIITKKNQFTIYNFMLTKELEKAINESEVVLSRSGYTTIMDLAKLNKKAFFIPTPGQFEQEYLAKHLQELQLVPSCNQADFKTEMLHKVNNYKGLKSTNFDVDFDGLFSLFERE